MDNKLRLGRLTELQGMLMHHDKIFKVGFNLDSWINGKLDDHGNVMIESCGTTACALGSACLYEPFMEQGLRLAGDDPAYYCEYGFDAGAAFFGIAGEESEFLFAPSSYENPAGNDTCKSLGITERMCREIKPEDVAVRVAKLIEKYKEEDSMR